MDIYDFNNEVLSPPIGPKKVRPFSQYKEYLIAQLPVLRARYPFLEAFMLRRKCKERWHKLTGHNGSQEQAGAKKNKAKHNKPKRRVSFNESAEVHRIGASQSQSQPQHRTKHFSPLKSEPAVPTANRPPRRTTIEIVPQSESPISRQMQELEIGRRGSSSSAAGGDRIIDPDDDISIPFPDSPTPTFQDTSPNLSPELSFSKSRSSDLFRPKQKTYTGISSRHMEQPVARRSPLVRVDCEKEVPVASSSRPKARMRMAFSEAILLTGNLHQSVSETVRLVPRRVLRTLESDLVQMVPRATRSKTLVKETPKTHQYQTPLLHPIQKKKSSKVKK